MDIYLGEKITGKKRKLIELTEHDILMQGFEEFEQLGYPSGPSDRPAKKQKTVEVIVPVNTIIIWEELDDSWSKYLLEKYAAVINLKVTPNYDLSILDDKDKAETLRQQNRTKIMDQEGNIDDLFENPNHIPGWGLIDPNDPNKKGEIETLNKAINNGDIVTIEKNELDEYYVVDQNVTENKTAEIRPPKVVQNEQGDSIIIPDPDKRTNIETSIDAIENKEEADFQAPSAENVSFLVKTGLISKVTNNTSPPKIDHPKTVIENIVNENIEKPTIEQVEKIIEEPSAEPNKEPVKEKKTESSRTKKFKTMINKLRFRQRISTFGTHMIVEANEPIPDINPSEAEYNSPYNRIRARFNNYGIKCSHTVAREIGRGGLLRYISIFKMSCFALVMQKHRFSRHKNSLVRARSHPTITSRLVLMLTMILTKKKDVFKYALESLIIGYRRNLYEGRPYPTQDTVIPELPNAESNILIEKYFPQLIKPLK